MGFFCVPVLTGRKAGFSGYWCSRTWESLPTPYSKQKSIYRKGRQSPAQRQQVEPSWKADSHVLVLQSSIFGDCASQIPEALE